MNRNTLPSSSEAATLLCLSSSILFPISVGREQDLSRDCTKGPQWDPFDTVMLPISPATDDDDLVNLISSSAFSPQGESFRVRSMLLEFVGGNLVL